MSSAASDVEFEKRLKESDESLLESSRSYVAEIEEGMPVNVVNEEEEFIVDDSENETEFKNVVSGAGVIASIVSAFVVCYIGIQLLSFVEVSTIEGVNVVNASGTQLISKSMGIMPILLIVITAMFVLGKLVHYFTQGAEEGDDDGTETLHGYSETRKETRTENVSY